MNTAEQSFAAQLALPRGGEPGFLAALRAAGRDAFLAGKLPTAKDEDWRFTNLAPLAAQAFAPAPAGRAAGADLPPAPRLVFANGRLDPAASDLAGLPAGVRLSSLAAALRERPAAVEPRLGVGGAGARPAFVALNAALFDDGALVELDAGVKCQPTLHLVFCSHAGGGSTASHPRNLIALGDGAQATVVEHYQGRGAYLVNAVTEVALGAGAQLEHDRLQEDAPEAFHVSALQLTQGAASRFVGQSIALGGRLARVEARALLAAEQARCDLHGLNVSSGTQLHDHFVHVDHASPRCTSREVFKGILGDTARGVFAGRILVRPGAQKTDAGQVSSSLLLSDDAVVDTKPQLEILADDVKCSHGGSVGQLSPDQLFYLRSRGISEPLARALLTWAFAAELVQRVGPEELRARVRRAVTARLPSGELLREVA
ncbi:Fe-S cluster assembly protein SufD [Anaeromyxobacter diazotrophicus]|uniref:Fe-S cluster assembly protein SufD n=1 Tax=Anaeromyxobacter diazotrophicus TaxID=2590199 RepID=A0A7I9VG20_9BACT|nr:Fe-S cluster assembly protein SufD [Anaeromyxobacter diazotrophicus]GEJ55341.1 Fe-S cluster assembly protein SufD [Anaeromyxobacter diazotrophicus]